MTHAERTGKRSLLYSGWHRPDSTARYLGRIAASKLCMIDIDSCEYCCFCKAPVALVETQESTHAPKSAAVTAALARMAGLPAFSVSLTPDQAKADIVLFRVRQLTPDVGDVMDMGPAEYAAWLLALRGRHVCKAARSAA